MFCFFPELWQLMLNEILYTVLAAETDDREGLEATEHHRVCESQRNLWDCRMWNSVATQILTTWCSLSHFTTQSVIVCWCKIILYITTLLSFMVRVTLCRNGHCVSKKVPTFELSVTLSNLNRFSKFLHCWKAYKICYTNHMTLPTSP